MFNNMSNRMFVRKSMLLAPPIAAIMIALKIYSYFGITGTTSFWPDVLDVIAIGICATETVYLVVKSHV